MIEQKFRSILVDFPVLVDTDEGCIRYLLKKYPNSPYFLDYMKDTSDYYIRYALLTRKEFNPLSILFKEDYLSSIDDLYKELKSDHWEEVLELSYPTDILKFFNTVIKETGYSVTVNCSNIHEQVRLESFKNIDSSWKIGIDIKNIRKYFCLYIKNILSLRDMNRIEGKSIYLYDYGPNYENYKEKKLDPIVALLGKTNIVKTIFPYNGFEFPVDEQIMEEENNEISDKRS